MGEARLIRSVSFRATHHYRRPEWSEGENRRVFGTQTVPHAHEWRVEVHVVGVVDEATGWAADLGSLDEALRGELRGWDGGDLNALVGFLPSTENLARHLFDGLCARFPGPGRVVQVRVFESPDLGAAYPA